MALRAFQLNPALGGFGGGFSSDSGATETHAVDAFVQILKELVDNGIDACSIPNQASTNEPVGKRVRVTVEPIMTGHKGVDVDDDDEQEADRRALVRVTVADNGGGMEDIQQCVNPFRSKKQIQYGATDKDESQDDKKEKEHHTFGRYGVGLTLCLLHAQRLVPNSSSQITSATQNCAHWTNTIWVVDTCDDTVKCVKQWRVNKTAAGDCGTKVTLVLPGGIIAERAWIRLEEYLNRFHLSFGRKCSIEAFAPSLCRVPIHVNPFQIHDEIDESPDSASETSISQQIKALAAINEHLLAIRDGTQKYTTQPIELKNIAHSKFPIRGEISNASQTSDNFLEVTLIVLTPDDESEDDGEHSALPTDRDGQASTAEALEDAVDPSGRLRLIRLVNSIPMLDTQEALGCGMVNKLASLRQVWFSFGLDVCLARSTDTLRRDDPTPTLEVRDSYQILPFLARGSHEAFQEVVESDDDESSKSSLTSVGSDIDDKRSGRHRRDREYNRASKVALPARIRFANTLIVVHVHGTPSTLPLPTLSKGCLPADNKAIDDALELGLTQCLRSLQRSNPSLLFSTSILQSSERDARYVPLLATAVTSIVLGFESRSNDEAVGKLRSWQDTRYATGSDESDAEDDQHTDSTEAIDESSDVVDSRIEMQLLVSFAEAQIQRRLEQIKAPSHNSEADSQSTSSSDQERAAKRFHRSLLNSSSEVGSVDMSEGSGSTPAEAGGSSDSIGNGSSSELNDWL